MSKTKPAEFVRKTEKHWQGQQSWNYEALYRYGRHKLKVDIKRDAYDFQSHLRVKVFDSESLQWHVLACNTMDESRASHAVSYVRREASIEPFRRDAKDLLEEARMILDE